VVILLAAAYLGCCAGVDQNTVLGHTVVNGVDLRGMTQSEAENALQAAYEQTYGQAALTVEAEGQSYTVSVAQSLGMDTAALAQQAMERGHGAFLTRGAALLTSLVGQQNRTVLPEVVDEAALKAAVAESGLLEIDTTVQTTYEQTADALVFQMGTTGVTVDEAALVTQLEEQIAAGDYTTSVQAPLSQGTVTPVDVDALYNDVYTQPENATLDPDNNYAIVAGVDGVSFDQETAKSVLESAGEGMTVEIPLVFTAPDITTDMMNKYLFRDQLGTYTTSVSGTAARRSNVRLAGEKCNGTILLPGETFSYNGTVGQRTAEAGFQAAGAYLNGESVQEIGGGICQTSSTLYNAVLLANLEITERRNHTYISSYVPLGQDATVSWGGPDFKFTNNTDYPIKVVVSYANNRITCSIYGTNLTGEYVKITNEKLATIDYNVTEKKSADLYEGETKVSVSGVTGAKAQTYRSVYASDGTLISKTAEAYSVYSKKDQVVLVGTKKKPETTTEEPTDTTTGETTDTTTETATEDSTTAAAE
jgi:vancomycin resistance protein YoaR